MLRNVKNILLGLKIQNAIFYNIQSVILSAVEEPNPYCYLFP